ncbi:MAG TPA: DUF5677 domain-containing protein [Pyrinomonadaceae bacterium]|nr:DUF5677 domain-containing protein [Pyrinomonadaceae bacterium]
MSDKEEFEFGHFDRQEHFFKAFKPFLLHLPELQETFDLVIGNIAKHADDLPKRIIFCLGRMAWEDLNEILLLCANGFNSGGYKVLRPMFEHVLYANHFRLHPEDSDRFWDYNSVDRYKAMRQITIEYPNAFPDEQFQAAKTAYEALGDSFKVPVCRECRPIRCLECSTENECQRCKKTKDHFTWTERDIVSMAREQEIDIMILTGIYYFAMQETHPKVISIVNRLESGDEGSYGFTDAPNWDKVRDVIVGAHYLILRVIDNWAKIFDIDGLTQRVEFLVGRHKEVWKDMRGLESKEANINGLLNGTA